MKRKFGLAFEKETGDAKEGELPPNITKFFPNEFGTDNTNKDTDVDKDQAMKDQSLFGSPPDSAYSSLAKSPFSPPPSTSTGYCSSKGGNTPCIVHGDNSFRLNCQNSPKTQTIKEALRMHFKIFKNDIEPNNSVSDLLYQAGFIQDTDIENIKAAAMRARRADVLIKALARSKKASEFGALINIQKVFIESGYAHLVEYLKPTDKGDVETAHTMAIDREEIFRRMYAVGGKLEADLEPRFIIDDMLQNKALTFNDHQDILDTVNRRDRVHSLMKYVMTDPLQKFPIMCSALHNADDQCPEIEAALTNGKTDPTLNDFVPSYKLTLTLNECKLEQRYNEGATQHAYIKFNLIGKREEVEVIEMDVVEENTKSPSHSLEAEAMEIGLSPETFKFSSIKINLQVHDPDSYQKLVLACQNKVPFAATWLQTLLDAETITKLRNAKTNEIKVTVSFTKPNVGEGQCSCKFTKEAIVENFSMIEREMPNVEDLLPAFLKFDGISNECKHEFSEVLDKPVETRKNEFLMKLLRMNDECKLYCCLFAKELKRLGKDNLIKNVTQPQHENAVDQHVRLRVRNIKRNYSMLLKEIEPKQFIAVLQGNQMAEENILKATDKMKRAGLFLDFVISQGQKCVNAFAQELERLNMSGVLKILKGSALPLPDGPSVLKRNLVANYRKLVDEIEPRVFRKTFLERRIFYAKHFDEVAKLRSRQDRAVALLKLVLRNGESAVQCLVDALQINEYDHLVELMTKVADDNTECPQLAETGQANNCMVFTASFDVHYENGGPGESDLQTYIHKLLYSNKENSNVDTVVIPDAKVDKNAQIQQWVGSIEDYDVSWKRKRRWSDIEDYVSPEIKLDSECGLLEKKACFAGDIKDTNMGSTSPKFNTTGSVNPFFSKEFWDDGELTPDSGVSSVDSAQLRHDEAASVGTSISNVSPPPPIEDITPPVSPCPLSPSVLPTKMMTDLDVSAIKQACSYNYDNALPNWTVHQHQQRSKSDGTLPSHTSFRQDVFRQDIYYMP